MLWRIWKSDFYCAIQNYFTAENFLVGRKKKHTFKLRIHHSLCDSTRCTNYSGWKNDANDRLYKKCYFLTLFSAIFPFSVDKLPRKKLFLPHSSAIFFIFSRKKIFCSFLNTIFSVSIENLLRQKKMILSFFNATFSYSLEELHRREVILPIFTKIFSFSRNIPPKNIF